MNDRRFCVYAHILDGAVFYIGHGTKDRPYRKVSRNKQWASITLNKEYQVQVLDDKLTKAEAIAIEAKLICNPKPEWNLCNVQYPAKVKELDFNYFNEILCYSESSPSGLVWKTKRSNGKGKKGDTAGSLNKAGYYAVKVNKKLYQSHRLVYLLNHGSISSDLVINHKDGNRSNNRVENLEQVSYALNNTKTLKNSEPLSGIRFCQSTNKSYFIFRWTIDGKRKSAYFEIKPDASHVALYHAINFKQKVRIS